MSEFADAIAIEFYNGSAWIDISSYVVGIMRGSYGLGGWKPENRVAVVGSLNVILNNKAKLFSPMGGDALRSLNTLSGFIQGARIRIRISYAGNPDRVIWSGSILSIDSDDKNWGEERARLVAVDWMNVPANYPMKRSAIALTKRMNEAIDLILARVSLQPEAKDLDIGISTFAAVFDNVKNKTMAISELNKLALSELGYVYVKGDGTLRAENSDARAGSRPLDTIPEGAASAGFLLKEDGDHLLTESAGRLILDLIAAVALYQDSQSYNIFMDPNAIVNSAIVRAYPVITDTSLKVLYSLGVPLRIPGHGTAVFSAHYTDPNGLGQLSGTNMQTPAATTDYLFNELADGSGTNLTANLVVTATYYGDTVEYSILNNADASGYLTRLQARGYGIYYGNSIETQIDDAASQAAYGNGATTLDQRYQRNARLAEIYAQAVIEEYKTPKSRITRMSYLANLNEAHMMAFLFLSVGSLIRVIEDRSAISRHYYITDVAFTIRQGGIIEVTYGLKQNDTFISGGLAPIAYESAGSYVSPSDHIDFGYIPRLDNLGNFSISVWLYMAGEGAPLHENMILTRNADNLSGWSFYEDATRRLRIDIKYSTTDGTWITGTVFSAAQWAHVVFTRTPGLTAGSVKAYVNGSSVSVSLGAAPSGSQMADDGGRLILGNFADGVSSIMRSFNGKLFDVRIYGRVLTAAEAAALYNSGVPDLAAVPDGLIFEAPGVNSDLGDATSLAGTVLTASDRLLDNALRAVGTPHGSPTIAAGP